MKAPAPPTHPPDCSPTAPRPERSAAAPRPVFPGREELGRAAAGGRQGSSQDRPFGAGLAPTELPEPDRTWRTDPPCVHSLDTGTTHANLGLLCVPWHLSICEANTTPAKKRAVTWTKAATEGGDGWQSRGGALAASRGGGELHGSPRCAAPGFLPRRLRSQLSKRALSSVCRAAYQRRLQKRLSEDRGKSIIRFLAIALNATKQRSEAQRTGPRSRPGEKTFYSTAGPIAAILLVALAQP